MAGAQFFFDSKNFNPSYNFKTPAKIGFFFGIYLIITISFSQIATFCRTRSFRNCTIAAKRVFLHEKEHRQMISYRTQTLDNGLRVLAHRDPNTCMAAVNILYCVGARNENPDHTGFAHLFEHLMFRGTKQVPDFDLPLQMACGENNAFTNNDYTDYYITLPQDNIETALWLEADRMTGLDISPDALQTEKNVVIEEFNQRYLNQPYGDMWMLLRGMVYKVHPYRWATIGLTPDHIRSATIEDVRRFYKRYYRPSNAILSVASVLDEQRVFDLAAKWFSDIEDTPATADAIADEPPQTSARRMEVRRNVPATAITIALRMGRRLSLNYYL